MELMGSRGVCDCAQKNFAGMLSGRKLGKKSVDEGRCPVGAGVGSISAEHGKWPELELVHILPELPDALVCYAGFSCGS